MTKLVIPVNQQLDLCGDEFLDERDFEIVFDFSDSSRYVPCTIDGKENCRIKMWDLDALMVMLAHLKEQR